MRFALIDAEKANFPVDFMCGQLGVSRSGFYAWRNRSPSEHQKDDEGLAHEILAAHQQSRRTYGSPRVHEELKAAGRRTSRKRIARLMKERHLVGRRKRRFRRTTDSKHAFPIADNRLARAFGVDAPNKVWVTDITYIWTREGWLYLAAIHECPNKLRPDSCWTRCAWTEPS